MKPRDQGAESPAIEPVPASAGPEPGLILAAQRACGPAALLLAAAGAPFLAVTAELRAPRPRTTLRYLSYDFAALEPPVPAEGTAELRDAERLLRRLGVEIARQLALRWPANARPKAIGVVTDGVGVAVSGSHPAPLSREWLSDHVAGRARVSPLLAFGPRGRLVLDARPATPILQ